MAASRRRFLTAAAAAAAAPLIAAPAMAQGGPEVRWKLTSAFQPRLNLIYGGALDFAKSVSGITGGAFQIAIALPGEIATALDALDAVASGKADCAHTALAYAWNTDPAYVFGTGAPFGMNSRQHAAWLQEGGGTALIDDLLGARNLMAIPLGDTGGQMAGWFRKEIRKAADFSGLKLRVGGFAGKVFETLGATLVNAPRDKIMPMLSGGALDGFEWIGPYDDDRFSMGDNGEPGEPISKVAPFYYYPGWWKGGMQLHLVVAKDKFESLPKSYQETVTVAAAAANAAVRARYDAANPGALKRLVVQGAELRLFPQDALEACYKAANDLAAQLAAANPAFKKLADSYGAFRADEYLWWQVAEYSFDNFMIRERRSNKS